MMLGLYVTKSKQRGEIETGAPELTINMILLELRQKHLGLSRVERLALYYGSLSNVCLRSSWSGVQSKDIRCIIRRGLNDTIQTKIL